MSQRYTARMLTFAERVAHFFPHQVRAACVAMCMHFHADTLRVAGAFFAKLRRRTYVTPTSYLELLSTFKSVLQTKRAEVGESRDRFQIGLDKLISTADQVAKLQEELRDMEPKLIAKINASPANQRVVRRHHIAQ